MRFLKHDYVGTLRFRNSKITVFPPYEFEIVKKYVCYRYETGNGIAVDEAGYQRPSNGGAIQVIQGSNAYTAPDGTVIQTQYVADENGYQPVGSHLPTPPPADPQIIRALEYLASLPSTPEPAYAPSQ